MWRARALEEHAQRGVEQREAVRRERELVTVLHSELIRNETLVRRAGLAPQAMVPAHRRALIRRQPSRPRSSGAPAPR